MNTRTSTHTVPLTIQAPDPLRGGAVLSVKYATLIEDVRRMRDAVYAQYQMAHKEYSRAHAKLVALRGKRRLPDYFEHLQGEAVASARGALAHSIVMMLEAKLQEHECSASKTETNP